LNPLEYSRRRVRAVLKEIRRLKESEFPYLDSLDALNLLEDHFQKEFLERLEDIAGAGYNPLIVNNFCEKVLTAVFDYLPFMGFILRSTNVRNAFEVHGPLKRLALDLLTQEKGSQAKEAQESIRLILSSEWIYSPITYPGFIDPDPQIIESEPLSNFALIGFPAPESSNPLVIPLAGHELGHLLWLRRMIEPQFDQEIQKEIFNFFNMHWDDYEKHFQPEKIEDSQRLVEYSSIYNKMTVVYNWAILQAEESFCDFVGVMLFRLSYLHAFAYLFSPLFSGERPLEYPNHKIRAENLVSAANEYGIECPEAYGAMFEDFPIPSWLTDQDKFLLEAADHALKQVLPKLKEKARELVTDAGLAAQEDVTEKEDEVIERFKCFAPAEGAGGIANILNAAWWAYDNLEKFWDDPSLEIQKREEILKHLVLKSIEIMEIEQRKGQDA